MEDSGFDSGDVKFPEPDERTPIASAQISVNNLSDSDVSRTFVKPSSSTALLQKRIEKRIEQARRAHSTSNGALDQQPRKSLMPINRLHVPNKINLPLRDGAEQPLVLYQSDDSSEDEYELCPPASQSSTKEISKQLQKDGFNLDLTPDDDDLDLIPPKSFNSQCICCQWSATSCTIQ